MSASAERSEIKNPKTGMTLAEMKEFIRNHFEKFVNRKNLRIGEVVPMRHRSSGLNSPEL
jgi:hypothetical protein